MPTKNEAFTSIDAISIQQQDIAVHHHIHIPTYCIQLNASMQKLLQSFTASTLHKDPASSCQSSNSKPFKPRVQLLQPRRKFCRANFQDNENDHLTPGNHWKSMGPTNRLPQRLINTRRKPVGAKITARPETKVYQGYGKQAIQPCQGIPCFPRTDSIQRQRSMAIQVNLVSSPKATADRSLRHGAPLEFVPRCYLPPHNLSRHV
ncbi:hypothetical protein CC78DRAFT_582174 [Lojkania enalia]|uniref:Uncharacterized protein n=1 Tax=Lojkania enalia TaxID=147567 RepID=A0A9P4K886_9PLEO|nr:hypothetical protein CC78DRAFT_582174 [Didymosphaeria enalia]